MNIHFTSIGGSIMHQLAISLKNRGYHITGSDDEIVEPAYSNLKKNNLLPQKNGWDIEKISPDLDAVILGMHAREDNPELKKALELKIPVYSFPEFIFEESKDKTRIVVGGSHGKTSTTAMIMHVLKYSLKKFDFLVGAKIPGFNNSVSLTNAPVIVCEGDEYPASAIEKRPKFHFLYPHIAVLTGIAWDHINVFPTWEFYLEQFSIYINKIEPDGLLIYNETDEVLKNLVETNRRHDIQYQPYGLPDFEVREGKTFIRIDGYEAELKVFGEHNLLNMQAAYFVCKTQNIYALAFLEAISGFTGAAKRLEIMASGNNKIVFRDFAHAPSKVMATIQAVKSQYPNKKLIAVLELHTYSSLSDDFLEHYKNSLNKADEAAVFYSKHALALKRLPDLNANRIKEAFNMDSLQVFTEKQMLVNWLQSNSTANCNILLMSSGTFDGADIETFAKTFTSQP